MNGINKETIQEIISQLEGIQESLLDMSSNILQEAIEDGETKAPPEDKLVTKALRGVNKAVRSLDDLSQSSSGETS